MKVATAVETAATEMAHPARHAARGGAATLAVLALLTNAMRNRGVLVSLLLLRWRRAFQALSVTFPSRSVTAVSVFVGECIAYGFGSAARPRDHDAHYLILLLHVCVCVYFLQRCTGSCIGWEYD